MTAFLKSSQASQNSTFSQYSDFKKALNAARPSGGREGRKHAETALSVQIFLMCFPRNPTPLVPYFIIARWQQFS